MKFRIIFHGCPNGTAYFTGAVSKVPVDRIVEADNIEQAKLKAYDTHEHIGGGTDGVRAFPVEPVECSTCEHYEDPAKENEGKCKGDKDNPDQRAYPFEKCSFHKFKEIQ
jgi:hypothetical protein